jgi:hypothetical protein
MKRLAIGLVAGTLALTACQSASEVLTEQILEQVDGVDNVEIDTDTGQVNIETDEGSVSIGGGDIPDGFPVPVPNGGDVTAVFTSPDGSSVTLTYAIDRYDELVMFYADWTAGQQGEWNMSASTFSSGEQTIRSSSWSGSTANEDVNVTVIDCFDLGGAGDGYNAACVTVVTS